MKFINFHAVWLLWLVPVVALGLIWSALNRRRMTRLMIDAGLWNSVLTPLSPIKRILKPVLIVIALFFIVLTLMRPQWGYQLREIQRKGVDLYVVLDTSQSMMAEDIKPNRMERARRELKDLLELLHGDRIGLISFAGTSFVSCPLTSDYDAFAIFIDQLATDMIPVQGTDIGAAVQKALNSFSKEEGRSKAIVLITDGEDTGDSLEKAIAAANEQQVKVFAIGLGSLEGAPIPDPEKGGFKTDEQGNVVLSKLNETQLQEIATQTGGTYVRSVTGDMDLEQIYLKGIKSVLEEKELKSDQKIVGQERFQIPLLLAVLFLFLEPFVREVKSQATKRSWFSRFRKQKLTMLLLLSLLPVSARASVSTATQAYNNGNFDKAAQDYEDVLKKKPDDRTVNYNLGSSYYKQGKFDEAQKHFLNSLTDEDPAIREKSLYNLGNAAYRQNKLEEAISYYDKALQMNPDNQKAKLNREFVAKKLEEQKQQQDQQQQDQQQQDQQQQDQQQQDQQQQDQQQQDQQQQDQQQQDQQQQDQQQQDQQQQDQQQQDQQQQDQQQQDQQQQDQQQQDQQQQDPSETKPHEMSEKEMDSWLNAIEDNPKNVMKDHLLKENARNPRSVGKDW